MNKYDFIKKEMTIALKNGDKLRRMTLADMIATIDKAATSGKKRVEITDALVNEVLIKYKKTIQEMVDTCPDTEKYAENKAESLARLAIATEFAPRVIEDKDEIIEMINVWSNENSINICSKNKGAIMKGVMPFLKSQNCDMKIAQEAIKIAISNGDIIERG